MAHALTLEAYRATAKFPRDEQYGLTSQIRRAASSIPANIAEGCGRASDAEFARFLQIAMGSASELEYHLLLARDLELIDEVEHAALNAHAIQAKRMLSTFFKRLRWVERLESRRPIAESRRPIADSR